MSHTTRLRSVAIRDISAIYAAAAALKAKGINCEIREKARPRMYYNNQHGECDYVLHLKDCQYDVGFDKQDDGSYAPVYDEWAGKVGREIGASCPMPNTPEGKTQHQIGQFLQEYSKAATINAATASGYMVESANVDADGNVQLILTGM